MALKIGWRGTGSRGTVQSGRRRVWAAWARSCRCRARRRSRTSLVGTAAERGRMARHRALSRTASRPDPWTQRKDRGGWQVAQRQTRCVAIIDAAVLAAPRLGRRLVVGAAAANCAPHLGISRGVAEQPTGGGERRRRVLGRQPAVHRQLGQKAGPAGPRLAGREREEVGAARFAGRGRSRRLPSYSLRALRALRARGSDPLSRPPLRLAARREPRRASRYSGCRRPGVAAAWAESAQLTLPRPGAG